MTAPARGRRVGRPPLLVRRRVGLAPRALHQMNLQLHHVISDITRQTGLAFVDAMLAGVFSLCSSPRQPIAVIRSSIEDCDHEMRRSLEEFQPLRQPGAPSDEAPKTNPTDRLPKVSYGRNKSALRPRSHPNFVWRDWSQFSRNLAAPRVRFLDRPTEGRLPSRDRAAHGCAVSPRQQKRPR